MRGSKTRLVRKLALRVTRSTVVVSALQYKTPMSLKCDCDFIRVFNKINERN